MDYPYEHSTVTEDAPVDWKDVLGAGFAEHTRRVEERLRSFQDTMWKTRPGAPADTFQRYAGYCEALVWVLSLTSQKQPKPGGMHDQP